MLPDTEKNPLLLAAKLADNRLHLALQFPDHAPDNCRILLICCPEFLLQKQQCKRMFSAAKKALPPC